MPAILTATVMRWEVEEDEEEEEELTFAGETPVSMYVGDVEDSQLEVMIVGKYILDGAAAGLDLRELLEAARDGLLQVTNVDKREVTPPPVPLRHTGAPAVSKPRRQGKKE
jgi:hypothetical protein